MSNKLLLVVTSIVAVSLGCGPSPADVSTAPAINLNPTSGAPPAVADMSKPDSVVAAFLDALRDGDDETAEALLTTIARRETKEHELAVQPPGAPSARYTIGEVKHVQGGVHVNSIWSEFDPSGEETVYEIVWVLRQEPIGWRVAGMATAVNPAKPPIYLNFEDVPDLLQKWKLADAELAAQAEQSQTLNAAQPATTLQR
ncbi:MAG: hypothetical protein O3C40_12780, partial [Planctomycetota bacterium]|nr:hypothetical protein [Planctomycetota bacterium]